MRRSRLRHLTRALTLREQRHRRATLLGIATLLVLSMSPVVGHHLVPFETEALLADFEHLGVLCLAALHLLFAPVHPAFHLATGAGLAYAAWDRFRASRIVRESLGVIEVRKPAPGDAFWAAARTARVPTHLLRIVPGLPSPAFTAGMMRPRIYVAESLCTHLSAAELAAVVAHEGAHAMRRDPLRLSVLRALACVLFWLPAVRRLADDVRDQAELYADDMAAGDEPLVLASALIRVAEWPSSSRLAGAAVGFSHGDLLELRVRRLVGEEIPVRSHVTRRSLLAAMAALALVWTSSMLGSPPVPAEASGVHANHCEHHRESPLAHLICLGTPSGRVNPHCAHQHG